VSQRSQKLVLAAVCLSQRLFRSCLRLVISIITADIDRRRMACSKRAVTPRKCNPAHFAVLAFNAKLELHETALLHRIDMQLAQAFDILGMHQGLECRERPSPNGPAHVQQGKELVGAFQFAGCHGPVATFPSGAASAASLLSRFASIN